MRRLPSPYAAAVANVAVASGDSTWWSIADRAGRRCPTTHRWRGQVRPYTTESTAPRLCIVLWPCESSDVDDAWLPPFSEPPVYGHTVTRGCARLVFARQRCWWRGVHGHPPGRVARWLHHESEAGPPEGGRHKGPFPRGLRSAAVAICGPPQSLRLVACPTRAKRPSVRYGRRQEGPLRAVCGVRHNSAASAIEAVPGAGAWSVGHSPCQASTSCGHCCEVRRRLADTRGGGSRRSLRLISGWRPLPRRRRAERSWNTLSQHARVQLNR